MRNELAQPDIQLMANPIRLDANIWIPGFSKSVAHVFSIGVVNLHPHSRGSVSLASADPPALPKVRLNLFSDPMDFEIMRRGLREARRIYRAEPQGKLIGREITPGPDVESDAALDEYIRKSAVVAQHPVGTCAMGTGTEAVVDPQLRVRGVERLRVADASIMPTVPGGNTNAAAIMIGEKASDLVRGVA